MGWMRRCCGWTSCYQRRRVLNYIDRRGKGRVTREDVSMWIRDERFTSTARVVLHHSAAQLTDSIMALEVGGDGTVSTVQIERWLNSLKKSDMQALYRSLFELNKQEMERILGRVYEALDVTGDGKVTRADVEAWSTHEASFLSFEDGDPLGREKLSRSAREKLLGALDRQAEKREKKRKKLKKKKKPSADAVDVLSFRKFCKLFRGMSVRELRQISEDASFLGAVAAWRHSPDNATLAAVVSQKAGERAYEAEVHRESEAALAVEREREEKRKRDEHEADRQARHAGHHHHRRHKHKRRGGTTSSPGRASPRRAKVVKSKSRAKVTPRKKKNKSQ